MSENVNTLNGSHLEKEALRKLLELIMNEIESAKTKTVDEIPIDLAEESQIDTEVASKVPTVLGVYRAIKKINHAYLKFVKSEDGKTFEQMMEGVVPTELCFYLFKDGDEDTIFDLYIYDAQQGKFVTIGSTSFETIDVDLSGYWSKEELDITTLLEGYWSKEEFDPNDYIRKDEVDIITASEVQEIWNSIKESN